MLRQLGFWSIISDVDFEVRQNILTTYQQEIKLFFYTGGHVHILFYSAPYRSFKLNI